MKISTNKYELIKLNACESELEIFVEKFEANDALFSEFLKSNGWDELWWLISNVYEELSDTQKTDLRLLACDYAETSLSNFEDLYPDDNRPRQVIEAAKAFANGFITEDDLSAAREAARAAAWAAARAARTSKLAAREAAWAASESAAWAASESAAWAAVREKNTELLMKALLKWESK